MGSATNRWRSDDHAAAWLEMLPTLPHVDEVDAALLECIPERVDRFLDLGTGGGRLIALLLAARPNARAVGLDFSPVMLDAARRRFADDGRVEILEHDIDEPLPALGPFCAVVLAIHHCPDDRKRELYAEVFAQLRPGGAFLNLEHVSSPNERLHDSFLAAVGVARRRTTPPTSSSTSRPSCGGSAKWVHRRRLPLEVAGGGPPRREPGRVGGAAATAFGPRRRRLGRLPQCCGRLSGVGHRPCRQ